VPWCRLERQSQAADEFIGKLAGERFSLASTFHHSLAIIGFKKLSEAN
jgi:hypothetical protein